MFVHSSSATTATVFLAAMCAMDIVVAATEVTSETVVSIHDNLTIKILCAPLTLQQLTSAL